MSQVQSAAQPQNRLGKVLRVRRDVVLEPEALVRWAGCKRWLARTFGDWAPPPSKRLIYCEPFVGSGAILLAHLLDFARTGGTTTAYIADACPDVVALWQVVASGQVEGMLAELERIPVDATTYKAVRALDPGDDVLIRATRFVYLQACSFNGLWRVNSRGQHNVPRDGTKRVPTVDGGSLLGAHALLERAAGDLYVCEPQGPDTWRAAIEGTPSPAWFYVDPPYPGGFVGYTAEPFGAWDELHDALADRVRRGDCVTVSLPDTAQVRAQYGNAPWRLGRVTVRQGIAARASDRGERAELLICGGY